MNFGSNNKFNAKKSGQYDSKVEKMVAQKFKIMQNHGLISGFRRCNFHFQIIPELSHIEEYDEEYITPKKQERKTRHILKKVVNERAANYTPDFLYFDNENREYVALEVKSYITKRQADYPLRRKLFKHKIAKHNSKCRSVWRFEEIEI